jgi:ABC-type glutathione transport system ATPase component
MLLDTSGKSTTSQNVVQLALDSCPFVSGMISKMKYPRDLTGYSCSRQRIEKAVGMVQQTLFSKFRERTGPEPDIPRLEEPGFNN